MAKLRHLALWTRQPEKMADFYTGVFEMKEMYRTKNGSIHLSDGEVNLALLNANDPKDPNDRVLVGLNHFGFHISNPAETGERIKAIYPEGAPMPRPNGTSYAEFRGVDPDGNMFDLSTCSWSGATLPKDKGGPQL